MFKGQFIVDWQTTGGFCYRELSITACLVCWGECYTFSSQTPAHYTTTILDNDSAALEAWSAWYSFIVRILCSLKEYQIGGI